jgi:hypothetical protein
MTAGQTRDTPPLYGAVLFDSPQADEPLGVALRDLDIVAARYASGDACFEDFRAPVRRLCDAVREAGMPPERMLIHLKRAIDQRGFPGGDDGEMGVVLRRQIVSLAIAECFSDAEARVPRS